MDSALDIHRLQFAFTITFHYLFPQLTMGLALLIVPAAPAGCGVRGWGRDRLGTGRRGEGAEGVDVGFALRTGRLLSGPASADVVTYEVSRRARHRVRETVVARQRVNVPDRQCHSK